MIIKKSCPHKVTLSVTINCDISIRLLRVNIESLIITKFCLISKYIKGKV